MDLVRSVDRALDILETLVEGPRGVGAIARRVGLPKTTAYRLLLTLEHRGLIVRESELEEFELGPRLLFLGLQARARSSLYEAAMPVVRALRQRTGETVNLHTFIDDERICIASIEGSFNVRMRSVLGERIPLHGGASGRAMLAFWPSERIERYIEDRLPESDGHSTTTDPERLRADLAEARRIGYLVSQGQRSEGVSSVAAPIWGVEGDVIGSINVSGPSPRMAQRSIEKLGHEVRQAGLEISIGLGYVSRRPVALAEIRRLRAR